HSFPTRRSSDLGYQVENDRARRGHGRRVVLHRQGLGVGGGLPEDRDGTALAVLSAVSDEFGKGREPVPRDRGEAEEFQAARQDDPRLLPLTARRLGFGA